MQRKTNSTRRTSLMQRMGVLALSLLVSVGSFAGPITREQAQQRAEQFLANHKGARKLAPVQNRAKLAPRHGAPANTNDLYYVFDRGEGEGFIIVSGDDRTEPVLGYTDNGSFDYANLPDAMKEWLEGYAEELQYLQKNTQAKAASALPTHPAIDEMMTTKWNQGDPYNYYSPQFFNQGKSVSGCVATAMAQVLYYNRAKSTRVTLADMPGWTGRKQDPETGARLVNEGVEAGAVIDFDNCRNKYSGGEPEISRKAVGWLIYLCGVAVKMDFSNSGSGAYSSDVPKGCINYFGYRSDCKQIYRSSYSAADFDAIIYDQLAHGLVMYMSGGGHAYVCDGYDGNRYYHINWGWGGGGPDGFYLLSKLTPGEEGIGGNGGFGFSSGLAAVINMEPADYDDKAIPFTDATVKQLCVANWDTNADGELSFAEAAAVTDLGTVFKGQTTIRTFNELSYFTGLTAIADDAFNGCTYLTGVRLPENLTSIGARAFMDCRLLAKLQTPTTLESIGEEAFAGCRQLKAFDINSLVKAVEARTFQNCITLRNITLHEGIQRLGDQAFSGCTKMTRVTVESLTPQDIALGTNVFEGMNLAADTLYAMQGTSQFFEEAEQWKDFGTIHLVRSIGAEKFMDLVPGRPVYLYNVGRQSYLTQGEYKGIQSVVGDEPMQFIIYEGEDDKAGLYYLYSPDVTTSYKITGRRTGDGTIGDGVLYTVTNGALNDGSYWNVKKVADGTYTFAVPEGYDNYNAANCWGVQPDHRNTYVEGSTLGVYYDVPYEGHEADCQWKLVDYQETYGAYEAAQYLETLLAKAKKDGVEHSREQIVFDNLGSTYADIMNAQNSLRKKLGFILFTDATLQDICLTNWDYDGDGEFSMAEAGMTTSISTRFSSNSRITSLDILQYFENLTDIPSRAFQSDTKLISITLPNSVATINSSAFSSCSALEHITLLEFVTSIGTSAFSGCTALKTVLMANPEPESVAVSASAFSGLNLAEMTLQVPIGTKERYAALDVWKDFGSIVEVRTRTYPKFSPIQLNVEGYIYHIGTRNYLRGGEAYGTQAVVGSTPYVYQIKRQNNWGTGIYYFWSNDTGKDNKIFFRTSTDSKVGTGIKACFVDGVTGRLTDGTAPWQIVMLEGEQENVFTMQTPAGNADYVAGEYLGIQTNHATNAQSGKTYGTYWDVPYEGNERNCQWAFIALSDVKTAEAFDEGIATLTRLIRKADAQGLETTAEQAVLDDFEATAEQVDAAVRALREKLHLIHFADASLKQLCTNNWDTDNDDELSLDEAAAVTSLGTIFKANTALTSFEELRYFTGLTDIPAETFKGCNSLASIYLPAGVKSIGDGAFSGCGKLKYVALLTEDAETLVGATSSMGLSKSTTFFLPTSVLEAYAADAFWSNYNLVEFTGIPTVRPVDTDRLYGRSNGRFSYGVSGAPINGEPVMSCEAEATSPVGEYPIVIEAGTITTPGLVCVPGVYTINPSTLTVTASSYTREMGEANPVFEYTIKGFRNKETEEVLTAKPVVECDATADSPWGEYEIRVSGAEAQNYVFTYVTGTLTVTAPVGIRDLSASELRQPVYDLAGRRIATSVSASLPAGVYVVAGRKVVVK